MKRCKMGVPVLCSILLVLRCGLQLQTIGGDAPFEKTSGSKLDPDLYWDERQEMVTMPASGANPEVEKVIKILSGGFVAKSFAYVYGGKTAYKMQSGSAGEPVLACYMDNSDYSGVTVCMGQGENIDLTSYRKSGTAGIAFWAKSGPGVKTIYFGLLDDDSDDKKVQTKLNLGDFGRIDTTWNYYMIPIRKLHNNGFYWDANARNEVLSTVDWSKINEFRFSANKNENSVSNNQPVTMYVYDMAIIREIPGYINPDDYWNAFKSDVPDQLLHDFDSQADRRWNGSSDPKSQIDITYVKSTLAEGSGDAMAITYKLNSWCDAVYNYRDNERKPEDRDWTKHWGIKFDMYTERPYQPLNIQVQDGSDELFIASTGGQQGWSEVVVPFKNFLKFPYYQPPEARQNGIFDLDDVVSLDFKPSGEGTSHTFIIDNVRLTNDKEAKRVKAPEQVAVTVTGFPERVVTANINEGIFGINAATWDSDLLRDETAKRVKAINHGVVRFPGGLTSDEYHWKEVLGKKDPLVDIDEFLGFCKKSNTTPMITVNFGSGTVQEAAEWVRYANKEKKAAIKYWEIGNELYGEWHAFTCSAEAYGRRAREYIEAMKAVDPSIHVTVVWMLTGDWNRIVFEHTKDVADGVNIHHYPQETGEENDAGLLGSAQALDQIIPDVRSQLSQYGESGRTYQIWLTEWNSVDFRPGPQILTIVNALFVADYLGMLAKHNIDQGSYWNIHNNITEQGGDYGYLSRTSAPDGDNVPRPSYWAFLMASRSLGRGSLLEATSSDPRVTCYLSKDRGKLSLMLINKYPETRVETTLRIPGFAGKGNIGYLRENNAAKGPEVKSVLVKDGMKITLPAYSITTIALE